MILKDLISDYENGTTIKVLKLRHCISKAKIYKLLAKEGVPRERQSTTDKRRILKLNSKTTVKRYMQEYLDALEKYISLRIENKDEVLIAKAKEEMADKLSDLIHYTK